MSEDDRTDGDEPDPFAELDAEGDQVDDGGDTDPFAELDAGREGDDGGDTDAEPSSAKTDLGTAESPSSSEFEDPFDELDEVDEELAEEAFERMEVGELEETDVWETLAADEAAAGEHAVGAGAGETATDHVVDKREYCQRCPHFTEPPEVACEHGDGEILEVLTGDEFRVRGCPMVGEEGPTVDHGK
ncbi:hypothetical protein JCM17823_24890 [Halorubrum gandharaense]